jgi:cytochrome b
VSSTKEIRVWDALVRIFHWVLVPAFFIAYFTEDDFLSLHAWAGYTIVGLLVFRVVWGLIGSRHARFSDFVYSPRIVIQYLKDTLQFKAKRYIGHNPAGGAMIVAILVSLALTTITGLMVYGVAEDLGPLASTLSGLDEFWEDVFEEIHEFFANFTLFLVLIHVAGVVFESLLHRENLVRSMVTGYKRDV